MTPSLGTNSCKKFKRARIRLQVHFPLWKKKLWRTLRKTKTSPKLRHFLWRSLSGALAVKQQLRHEVSRWIQLAPSAVLVQKVLTICCSTALEQKKSGNSPWYNYHLQASLNSVFLNMHYLFACSKNRGLDLNLRLSFPWILWHVWKARNLFLFEHARMSAAKILSKALEEAAIWLNLHNLDQGTAPPAPVIAPSPQAGRKPLAGMVKCNVGCSWTEASNTCGGEWIVRDSDGKALCHSRRMFGGISACLQAEQVTFLWALAAMQDLKETTSDNGNLLPHDT